MRGEVPAVDAGLRVNVDNVGSGGYWAVFPTVLTVRDNVAQTAPRCSFRPQPGMRIMVSSVPKIDTGGERR